MNKLQKLAGVAALFEAAIYISAFIFYGAFWDYPVSSDDTQKFIFLTNNQVVLSVVNLAMYVVFGVFLAVLVLAIHQRMHTKVPVLSQIATAFGIIWVGLVIASGMIANVGLGAVIDLSVKNPEQAMTLWVVINTVVEGLGGGNEVVGGLWVLLLSIAGLKTGDLPKLLNCFGLFIGTVGILTIYPAEVLTEIFGLSQILWFSWLGVAMLMRSNSPAQAG
ncbi:hypothetical protein Q4567_18640 [Aliiglaciecola sp. 2_MG-2023]|uniref:hypothetical protein n=1 Tax=unclassified Aliiglaciecola TaxID=2593648 RepID=UPI0026E2816D|nr:MULTISPECIES: hypothetical protein [unclassified Aliiglaciecola]MDO6712759.1 hypothetical protein [Aliiglaciecola sp. 2_MG-2023]MDO6753842.1 hypothetical protein [Aliiglaciecola sp. 1_MG-2023]